MKNKKPLIKRVIASAIALSYTAAGFASCGAASSVYGPPPDDSTVSSEESFNPASNEAQDVYGPPIDFDDGE